MVRVTGAADHVTFNGHLGAFGTAEVKPAWIVDHIQLVNAARLTRCNEAGADEYAKRQILHFATRTITISDGDVGYSLKNRLIQ
jgi:hypothetical protein